MADAADDLEIALAAPDEASILANLMQLYVHDFSELWAGTERGEIESDGRFAPYPLESYWREADRIPLLFRKAGRPVGFALLNHVAPSGCPIDRNMAEFFVARKHRRAGLGRAAARAIFARWPGVWEVAVARGNAAALGFWERAIFGRPDHVRVEVIDSRAERWDGPIFRFTTGRPSVSPSCGA